MLRTWLSRDETPVLHGPRVTLRAPRAADYDEWAELRRDSREFLKPFEPRWSEADLSRRVFLARLKRGREEARERHRLRVLRLPPRRRTARPWSAASPSPTSAAAPRSTSLSATGWASEFVGQGLMTEAVGVVVPFVFDTLGLHRIHAAFLPHQHGLPPRP